MKTLPEHYTNCGTCGLPFDMRDFDQLVAHEHGGLREATGIIGAPKEAEEFEEPDKRPGLAHFTVPVLALVAFAFIAGGTDEREPVDERVGRAYAHCQVAVRKQLSAPSTAVFPWSPRGGDCNATECVVLGSVESDNSFGVPLASDWSCRARIEGKRLSVVLVSFE